MFIDGGTVKKLRKSCSIVSFVLSFVFNRQQIEDLEGKAKAMKEQLKKKDENERKYQGEHR